MAECNSTSRCGVFNISMKCGRDEGHIGNHQAFVPGVYKNHGMDAVFVWDTRLLSTMPIIPVDDWTKECQECGIKVENGIPYCFYCSYWLDCIKNSLHRSIRVDGVHYLSGGTGGYSGRTFIIEFFDDQPTLTTNSLWLQGKIPAHFAERLPNNANFRGEAPWVE